MTKNDVKNWDDLLRFARARAKGSAKRNDPWAWAYWRATALWAEQMREDSFVKHSSGWFPAMRTYLSEAKSRGSFDHAGAALQYSRAKWLAIMLRNRGVTVPQEQGPSLKWLHDIEG